MGKIKNVIYCSASWCQPCKTLKPIMDEIMSEERFNDVNYKKIDIENDEEAEEVVEAFKIRNVPTVLFLDENNELLFKFVGAMPKQSILTQIEEND